MARVQRSTHPTPASSAAVRRRRWALVTVLALAAAGAVWLIGRTSAPVRTAARPPRTSSLPRGASLAAAPVPAARRRSGTPHRPVRVPSAGPPAVGLRVLRFVDATRTIDVPGAGRVPRSLTTLVRYPAQGPTGALDVPGAPAARTGGPFPLIVFGHGYAVTPAPYSRLLQAWARAGYVVAAPVFPLENARAPGGPNENDLVNQPGDMSVVISRFLTATRAASGPFAKVVDPARIAVAGQSDGGDTALAAAYDPSVRDGRVGAAVILSGAQDPFAPAFRFPPESPPLLATQGTADTINPPSFTDAFYRIAPRPKYLLQLLGDSHLPPYTQVGAPLLTVERVTIAFLDRYLKGKPDSLGRLIAPGALGSGARLLAAAP